MAASRWTHHAWRHLAVAALLWAVAAAKPSVPVAYCAKLNTASMGANFSTYQSDGLCYDFCRKEYALAIVQVNNCWCSDYIPGKSSQVSTDKCSTECPGFPDDLCGGDGLFGYMALEKKPIGTATTGSTSSTTTKVPVKTESVQSTVQNTPTGFSTSSTSSTSKHSTTSSRSDPKKSDPPPVYRSTVTADGTVRTVTVAPTAGSSSNKADVEPTSKKLSTGAAVGVAVGVVAVIIALAAGIIFFFIRRRRQRRAEEQGHYDAPSHRGSSSGMMSTPKTGEMSENRYVGGSDGRAMSENWENSAQGKRRSTLMPVDPRLDPGTMGIYHRPENKSHESVNSLRDDQDYSRRVHDPSRVLRATNPDPVDN